MKPLSPTRRVTIPAMSAMWKAANPPVNPFWALYIRVMSPISVPVMVATPSQTPTLRPAPM